MSDLPEPAFTVKSRADRPNSRYEAEYIKTVEALLNSLEILAEIERRTVEHFNASETTTWPGMDQYGSRPFTLDHAFFKMIGAPILPLPGSQKRVAGNGESAP